jgi:polyisoprenoid-binding protein YceI
MKIERACIGATLILTLAACGPRESDSSSGAASSGSSSAGANAATLTGPHTFVIAPASSKASYRATEEFFPAALSRLGIERGKARAVGSTQAIEGRFQFDPDRPTVLLGENGFTVHLDTLKSDQQKRDDYIRQIRDDGPSFDMYPVAAFKATEIDGSSTPDASGRELTLKLAGDLTVREITKRVVFDVKARLAGDTFAGTATTHVLLSDFGIGPIDFPPLLAVADPLDLEVQFTARAQ